MTTFQGSLVCKGTSGMGNRILAACTALLYGELTHRKVMIDWRDESYLEDGGNAFPAYFDCSEAHSVEELPETDSVSPSLWNGKLDRTFGSLSSELNLEGYGDMSIDVSRGDYPEDILVFCAYTHKIKSLRPLLEGSPLAEMTTSEILSATLKSKIQPIESIQNLIRSYQSEYFTENMIGVHVRYTDIQVPLDKILQRVQKLVNQKPDPTIFLATDSEAVITEFRQRFGKVITADKWFPKEGQRLHQNWDNCPNRYQNGVEALRDMYLLAQCDRLVFSSQSSFGYVSSLLSNAEAKDIHDIAVDNSFAARLRNKSKRVLERFASAS